MANLNPWQKVDWVLQGAPFGDGSGGNSTINSDPNTRATITGTSGTNNPTLGSGILSDGDIAMVIQYQGTGAGNYEWIKVLSGGGTTTPVLSRNLVNSYGTGAQVIKVNRNNIATLSSFTVTAWNGTTGGISIILARTSISGSGTLSFNGSNGISGGDNTAGATGGGFRGGRTDHQNPSQSYTGEGYASVQLAQSSANSNAGGGASTSGPSGGSPGGGGGNVTAGSGTSNNGSTASSSDLLVAIAGGGGGGGANDGSEGGSPTGSGASGGAILILISPDVNVSGMTSVNLNGGNGGNASAQAGEQSCGGGGGGGICLIMCRNAILGTNKITNSGGTGGVNTTSGIKYGGDGGNGITAIHHSGTITGSTTPSYSDILDGSMVEAGGMLAFL